MSFIEKALSHGRVFVKESHETESIMTIELSHTIGPERDATNRKLNDWNGGRDVYFRDPNGHLLESLTRL